MTVMALYVCLVSDLNLACHFQQHMSK